VNETFVRLKINVYIYYSEREYQDLTKHSVNNSERGRERNVMGLPTFETRGECGRMGEVEVEVEEEEDGRSYPDSVI